MSKDKVIRLDGQPVLIKIFWS